MLHRKLTKNSGECKTPIQKNLDLGQSLQINGTPTLFLQNGSRISGIPKMQIILRKYYKKPA
jgi:thiol:disulfide interchange protein DsbC